MKSSIIMSLLALSASLSQAATLYSNGPVVGENGLSVTAKPGVNADYAFGMQTKFANIVADDFTVGAAGWTLQSIDFFASQNNATAFTLQNVSWSIVAGDVNNGTLVASGTTTLSNSGLVGYRVAPNALTLTNRPIYRASADIADVSLAAGTYWLRWSMTGSLSSGPWQVPTADNIAGNAMQSTAGVAFATAITANTKSSAELPFVLYGTVNAVPEPASWALLLGGGALVGLMARRRRSA